jgi:hypothetical protein
MIYIIILLGVLLLISFYVIYNLFNKVAKLETIVENTSEYLIRVNDIVVLSNDRLKEIDGKGTFSSDDEIGFFFKYVQQIQDMLNDYITKNIINIQ